MTFTKSTDIEITNKVFTATSAYKLLDIVNTKYSKRHASRGSSTYLNVQFTGDNGINYSAEKIDSKQIMNLISENKVSRITVNFFDTKDDTTLIIVLDDSEGSSSKISLKSSNSTWFNETRIEIQDYLSTVKDQNEFYIKYRTSLYNLSRLLLGIPTFYILNQIVSAALTFFDIQLTNQPSEWQMSLAQFLIDWQILYFLIFSFIIGYTPTVFIFDLLDKLWPKIEFDFGPVHKRKVRNSRKIWTQVATLIVIPILLALIV